MTRKVCNTCGGYADGPSGRHSPISCIATLKTRLEIKDSHLFRLERDVAHFKRVVHDRYEHHLYHVLPGIFEQYLKMDPCPSISLSAEVSKAIGGRVKDRWKDDDLVEALDL